MHRIKFGIAIFLFIGAVAVPLVSFREGWLTNLSEFTTLVISGVVVGMVLGAGGLLYKSFGKSTLSETEQIPRGVQSQESSSTSQSQMFETELSPNQVRVGGLMSFKVRANGILNHVCFQAEAMLPNGKIHPFPNEDTFDHLQSWFAKGKLTGRYNQVFEWKGTIPKTIRPGAYTFRVRAYQRRRFPRMVALELRILLWLKAYLIRSIDASVLYRSEWVPIHQDEYHVVISP